MLCKCPFWIVPKAPHLNIAIMCCFPWFSESCIGPHMLWMTWFPAQGECVLKNCAWAKAFVRNFFYNTPVTAS